MISFVEWLGCVGFFFGSGSRRVFYLFLGRVWERWAGFFFGAAYDMHTYCTHYIYASAFAFVEGGAKGV